jgi:hypothetical protein
MDTINLGELGLGGTGATGFKVSTVIYDEGPGRPDIILRFQAAKRVSGQRVENRNFSAGISVYHLLGLLKRYADNQGAERLIFELPKLEALVETVKKAQADSHQAVASLRATLGQSDISVNTP